MNYHCVWILPLLVSMFCSTAFSHKNSKAKSPIFSHKLTTSDENIISKFVDAFIFDPVHRVTSKKWVDKNFCAKIHHAIDPLIYPDLRQKLNRAKLASLTGSVLCGISCYRSKRTAAKVLSGVLSVDCLKLSYNCYTMNAVSDALIHWDDLPNGTISMGVYQTIQKLKNALVTRRDMLSNPEHVGSPI